MANAAAFNSSMHLLPKKKATRIRIKNIKNVTRCRDGRSAKSIETR